MSDGSNGKPRSPGRPSAVSVRPPPPSSRKRLAPAPELKSFFRDERLSNHTGGPVDSLVPVRLVDMTESDEEREQANVERRKRRVRGALMLVGALGVGLAIGLAFRGSSGRAPAPAAEGVAAGPVASGTAAPRAASDMVAVAAAVAPAAVPPAAGPAVTPAAAPAAVAPAAVTPAAVAPAPVAVAPAAAPAVASRPRRLAPRKAKSPVNPPTANFPD